MGPGLISLFQSVATERSVTYGVTNMHLIRPIRLARLQLQVSEARLSIMQRPDESGRPPVAGNQKEMRHG